MGVLTVLAQGIGGAVGLGTVEVTNRLGASLAISTASRTDKAERASSGGRTVRRRWRSIG
ncbi:hypothetical protein [Streptomyces sp. NPDC059759]|uniref:hypothetical protein n=1 Tax=Streptomyces sp. NPDC059759 TaxID=3346936 RepID=UPI0036594383